ncbi:hypothetical protein EHQ12_17655 [Leptospira gomenensis]|uniref:Uncharacterized protein n=1 Tax=Leptospira gomenensis TaxID=2484974 RepID=A0A5F1YY23_9LEPT|nr:hypothetical protein [Leptospira gomenensis]TGK29420.1 hypothetical protein EHQ17_15680 [Leptospira gomenensis]TGK33677.1 hypothetical protein EHQ12_17655 [Leptospira gomenensis]TGK44918.1 hypothetical protein EHQ07_11610 [Leptospira gomenensis]TGK64539.1 hypothetical protein EHQ13_07695 [Leptospira gomenensis]
MTGYKWGLPSILIVVSLVFVRCDSTSMNTEKTEGNAKTILTLIAPNETVNPDKKSGIEDSKVVQIGKTSEKVRDRVVDSTTNIPLAECFTTCQAFDPLVCPPISKGLICEVTVFPDDGPMEKKYPPADCFAGRNHTEALRSAKAYYFRMFCFGDGGKVP